MPSPLSSIYPITKRRKTLELSPHTSKPLKNPRLPIMASNSCTAS